MNKTQHLWLGFLMLVGMYLRIRLLWEQSYGIDEAWHLVVARSGSWKEVFSAAANFTGHPPLPYIMIHEMLKVSDNIWWIKSFALIPGILLIPASFALGNAIIGKPAGWYLTAMVTFSSLFVVQAGEIRGYSLMLLLAMLAMTLWWQKRNLIAYFLLMATALLCEVMVAPIIFVSGIYWMFAFFRQRRWRTLCLWGVTHILLALVCLFWVSQMRDVATAPNWRFSGIEEVLVRCIVLFMNYFNTALPHTSAGFLLMCVFSIPLVLGWGELWRANKFFPLLLFSSSLLITFIVDVSGILGNLGIWQSRRAAYMVLAIMLLTTAGFCRVHGFLKKIPFNRIIALGAMLFYCAEFTADDMPQRDSIPAAELSAWKDFLQTNWRHGDVIISGWTTACQLRLLYPKARAKPFADGVAELVETPFKIYFSDKNVISMSFLAFPYDYQEILRKTAEAGGLRAVKRIWFFEGAPVNEESYISNISPFLSTKTADLQKRVIDEQKKLSKKMAFVPSPENSRLAGISAIIVDADVVNRNITNAADFIDVRSEIE